MKLRTISLYLIISLIFVPAAQARPLRYHRPLPARHYYRHRHHLGNRYYRYSGSDWAIAGGTGLLLGMLIANNNSYNERVKTAEKEAYEKKLNDVQDFCDNTVRTEITNVTGLIAKNGLANTTAYLKTHWNERGYSPILDDRSTITVLTVTGLKEDVKLKYTFLKNLNQLKVTTISSEYGVSAEEKASYLEPTPISSFRKYVGFDISENSRDSEGRLLVGTIDSPSPAQMANIKNGDYIVKIDTYDIKNLKVENIGAYVENRAKNNAILKITYSRNGEHQTVALQL